MNSVFHKIKRNVQLVSLKIKILLLVSVWFSSAFAISVSELANAYPRTLQLTLAELSAAAVIICIGIIWPLYIISYSLNISYQAEMRLLDLQMQAQDDHYKEFLQANEDLRSFKHDFDQMTLGIIGCAKNDDMLGVLQVARESRRRIESRELKYKTGNFGIDALLTDMQTKAEKSGAEIDFDGLIPNEYVSTLDLCLILGNALDNAIEACAKLPDKKTIWVESHMNNGYLLMCVINPVIEDAIIIDNMIATTKEDKEKHGYGLISISRAVSKYRGEYKLTCADKVFTMKADLDLNPLM